MLNGLETRSVYLDNDLAEFVRRLPASYKLDGKNRKIVLKKAARGFLPLFNSQSSKEGFWYSTESVACRHGLVAWWGKQIGYECARDF